MSLTNTLKPLKGIAKLKKIMAILRSTEGCAWDKKQSHNSLIPFLIEESYEVIDAIEQGDPQALERELGDLLLQVVFHCQIATENHQFDFESVADSCCEMLIRRHPHIFGEKGKLSAEEVEQQWQAIKEKESAQTKRFSLLDKVPLSMPSILRQERLHKLVASQGFDWKSPLEVFKKLLEEVNELKDELESGDIPKAKEELGDVIMVCLNLVRHLGSDLEEIATYSNHKYTRRFQYVEGQAKSHQLPLKSLTVKQWEQWWEEAKLREVNPKKT